MTFENRSKRCGRCSSTYKGDTCPSCNALADRLLDAAVGPRPAPDHGYVTVRVNGYGGQVSIKAGDTLKVGDMVSVGADGLVRRAEKTRMDQATELARRELDGLFAGVDGQYLVTAIAEASAAAGASMSEGVAAVRKLAQAMQGSTFPTSIDEFNAAVGNIGKMRLADLAAKIGPMKHSTDRVGTNGADAMAHAFAWTHATMPPEHINARCVVNVPSDFLEQAEAASPTMGHMPVAKGPVRPLTAEVERMVAQFELATAPAAPRQSYIITDCGEMDPPAWENPRTAIQPSDYMCPYCYEDAPETGACPRGCNASPTGMWKKDKVHTTKGTRPDPSKALADLVKARDAVNRCGRCKAVEPGMCSSHQSIIDDAMRQAQAAAPALPKDAVTIAGRTYEWSQHRSAAVRGQMFELRRSGPGNPVLKSFVLRDVEMETADRSAILVIKKSMAEAELRDVVEALSEDA